MKERLRCDVSGFHAARRTWPVALTWAVAVALSVAQGAAS